MLNNIQYTLIGALTSKPYAFKARSWELQSVESIDIFDSICSNIKIDMKGSEIARILPVNNKYINDEWISDKSRHAYDGLKRWRFIYPMLKKNNIFIQTSWREAFEFLQNKIKNNKYDNFVVNTGHYTDMETITALQTLADKTNKNVIINNEGVFNSDIQNFYFDINNISLSQKVFLFVGLNLRLENPLLNIRFRKLSTVKTVLVAFIGTKFDVNINIMHLGNNISILKKIIEGKHFFVSLIKTFSKRNNNNISIKNFFKNSVTVIFGDEFNKKINSKNINILTQTFSSIKFTYNTLHNSVGKLNLLELGFYNNKNLSTNTQNIYYLIGTDFVKNLKTTDLVIFQGHHNDKIRLNFDVILPTINWTEKSSIYINCLGIVQKTYQAISPQKNTRLDWKITRMLSIFFNNDIKYNNIKEIHNRLNQLTPNITKSISKFKTDTKYKINFEKIKNNKKYMFLDNNPFIFQTPNYYLTNSVERSSKIMLECSNILEKKKNNFI